MKRAAGMQGALRADCRRTIKEESKELFAAKRCAPQARAAA